MIPVHGTHVSIAAKRQKPMQIINTVADRTTEKKDLRQGNITAMITKQTTPDATNPEIPRFVKNLFPVVTAILLSVYA